MASTKNVTEKNATVDTEASKTADAQPGVKNTKTEAATMKKRESVYTVDEFCDSAQALFQTRPECVRAALREKGVTQCTKADAVKIVEAFRKKEVK